MPMPMSDRDEPDDRDDRDEDELDEFVRAFELAYRNRGEADPAAFLPPEDHPLHAAVLRELVRVDMEYGWERGRPKDLSEYQRDFPALSADVAALHEIAFEEFRLRRQAGQSPSNDEYLKRYGVRLDVATGRFRALAAPPSNANGPVNNPDDGSRAWNRGATGPGSIPFLPSVGDEFQGFRLIGDLGRGSFGRVYLARQGDLADRPVVLKITADGHDESQTLAQLRHDNIVPIYSRHRDGPLRAVCMPYLGAVTLRDVFADLKAQGTLPDSGRGLLSSLGKSSIRKAARAGAFPSSATAVAVAAPGLEPRPKADADAGGRPRTRGDEPFPGWLAARGGSAAAPGGSPDSRTDASDARTLLGTLTYVEAVVWIAARLADGLAHAHDRGILHRDMKPANILLTDDGRPMLLDFNLAEDLKRPVGAEAASVGGTLPYMAPEHLEAFHDGGRAVDARSDLFAFGVIFYELLTSRPPFPVRDGARGDVSVLRAMVADRNGPPPLLRPFNPGVSPAVESVIRRCLEPEPARRYQSARELSEDLERHLAHRPLRHAPDPSRRERAGKLLRRHPRLAVVSAVLAVGLLVVGGFSAALAARSEQVDRLQASETLARFRDRSRDAQNLLISSINDREKTGPARETARRALDEFHVLDNASARWWDRPPASRLPAAEQGRLRVKVGGLLLSLSQADASAAKATADPEARQARLRDALIASERAEAAYGESRIPRALCDQRAVLLGLLGDEAGARRYAARATTTPLSDARDSFLMGSEHAYQGRFAEALVFLDEAIRLDPGDYWSWFLAGICHERLLHPDDAYAHFSTAIALDQNNAAPWYNRGLLLFREGKHERAHSDFDRAVRLRPDDIELLIGRAATAIELSRPGDAVDDLTRAIDTGSTQTRLYFDRARARDATGDVEGAKRDRREGMRREPLDEISWVARAFHKTTRERDYSGALDDLEEALKANPSSFYALNNKANVLAERLGKTDEAVHVIDRIVELFPGHSPARPSRGVLLARLGRRDAALADARESLRHNPSPRTLYQVAGIYALTSRQAPGDRKQALLLLETALTLGFGQKHIANDPDLDPIRDDPEFRRVLAEVKNAATVRSAPTDP
jgi:eukaryotic-like serine/threonine-protein kinase